MASNKQKVALANIQALFEAGLPAARDRSPPPGQSVAEGIPRHVPTTIRKVSRPGVSSAAVGGIPAASDPSPPGQSVAEAMASSQQAAAKDWFLKPATPNARDQSPPPEKTAASAPTKKATVKTPSMTLKKGPSRPKMTNKQALDWLSEVGAKYRETSFKRKLFNSFDAADFDYSKWLILRQEICVPVQIPIVAKMRFPASSRGVSMAMKAYWSLVDKDETVQKYEEWTTYLSEPDNYIKGLCVDGRLLDPRPGRVWHACGGGRSSVPVYTGPHRMDRAARDMIPGTEVEEVDRKGNRMKYHRLNGRAPEVGWVELVEEQDPDDESKTTYLMQPWQHRTWKGYEGWEEWWDESEAWSLGTNSLDAVPASETSACQAALTREALERKAPAAVESTSNSKAVRKLSALGGA